MKLFRLLIILSFFTQIVNAQKIDTIPNSTILTIGQRNKTQRRDLVGIMGPSITDVKKLNYKLIVNNFLISDTIKSNLFLKRFANEIQKTKYYSSAKGLKKYSISSQDGILFCKLKDNVIIDIETMEIVRGPKLKR